MRFGHAESTHALLTFTSGPAMSAFAARWLRGRPVAILRGAGQEGSTRRKKRLAAALSRRFCNRMPSSGALLVDRTPSQAGLATQRHEHRVEMPGAAWLAPCVDAADAADAFRQRQRPRKISPPSAVRYPRRQYQQEHRAMRAMPRSDFPRFIFVRDQRCSVFPPGRDKF